MRVIGAWCRTYIADAAVNRWVVTAVDPSLPRGDHLSHAYNFPVSKVDVRIDCIDLLVHRDVIHPRDAH